MLRGFPDLPPVWLLGGMVASWLLGQVPILTFGAFGSALGAVLVAVSLAFILWSAWYFWRKRTPIEPHHAPKALIVEGPYRVSRNPIYLALVVIAAGVALRQGGALALAPVPILFFVLDRRFARPEENALREAFGGDAEAYLAATRRWL
jgi:protein-S-isoprenylcysteine O-methyltransferase Ste14